MGRSALRNQSAYFHIYTGLRAQFFEDRRTFIWTISVSPNHAENLLRMQKKNPEGTVILRESSSIFFNFLIFFREIIQSFCQRGGGLSRLLQMQFHLLHRDTRSREFFQIKVWGTDIGKEKQCPNPPAPQSITWAVRVWGQACTLSRHSCARHWHQGRWSTPAAALVTEWWQKTSGCTGRRDIITVPESCPAHTAQRPSGARLNFSSHRSQKSYDDSQLPQGPPKQQATFQENIFCEGFETRNLCQQICRSKEELSNPACSVSIDSCKKL